MTKNNNLNKLLNQARSLIEAKEFDKAIPVYEAILRIDNMHPQALQGVRLQHQYSREGNWEPGYHYDSLVNVMWLQLHLAMLAGSLIRDCLGCGVTFEATRSNQTFHDSFCRGATNSRRTYKRNKNR